MGIASLILAICGALIGLTIFKDLGLILCVLGIVLGAIAIFKKKSRGIAIAGVIIAIIGLGISFAYDPLASLDNSDKTTTTTSSGSSTKKTTVTTSNVKIEKICYTKSGDMVARLTNNNKASVCLSSVTATFKDASGKFALKDNSMNTYIVIGAKKSAMVYFFNDDPTNKQ